MTADRAGPPAATIPESWQDGDRISEDEWIELDECAPLSCDSCKRLIRKIWDLSADRGFSYATRSYLGSRLGWGNRKVDRHLGHLRERYQLLETERMGGYGALRRVRISEYFRENFLDREESSNSTESAGRVKNDESSNTRETAGSNSTESAGSGPVDTRENAGSNTRENAGSIRCRDVDVDRRSRCRSSMEKNIGKNERRDGATTHSSLRSSGSEKFSSRPGNGEKLRRGPARENAAGRDSAREQLAAAVERLKELRYRRPDDPREYRRVKQRVESLENEVYGAADERPAPEEQVERIRELADGLSFSLQDELARWLSNGVTRQEADRLEAALRDVQQKGKEDEIESLEELVERGERLLGA